MSPVSPARRRAEEFASLIDGRGGDSRSFSEPLDLVALMQSVPAPAPNMAYVQDLRAGLMAAADTLLVPVESRLSLPAREATPRRRDRRIAVAATTLAILGGSTGVSFAAQNALPGDSLYPIKRILESARTSLSANDEARADRIMGLAEGRLDEAQALALRDSVESQAAIPTALEDFVAQASQAADTLLGEFAETGDSAHVVELRDFTADSLDVLAGLKSLVPTEFADNFDAAVNALLSIDERTLQACPDCGGLLDIPAILLSGAAIDSASVSPRTALAPKSDDPAQASSTDPIAALLGQLPALGALTPGKTAASTTASPSTAPTGGATGGATGPLGEVLDPNDTESPLSGDPLGDLLNPLLGPLLGTNGLL
jgi:hypothetical protein